MMGDAPRRSEGREPERSLAAQPRVRGCHLAVRPNQGKLGISAVAGFSDRMSTDPKLRGQGEFMNEKKLRVAGVAVLAALLIGCVPATTALAQGYPAGTGEVQKDTLDRIVDFAFRLVPKKGPLDRIKAVAQRVAQGCNFGIRSAFINGYRDEQNWIRSQFKGDYMLGRPVTGVKVTYTKSLKVRNYQIFDGGSWGRSSLTQPKPVSVFNCYSKPFLVTGTMYSKWSQIGHINTLGGPVGGQYWNGPYINQNFERGQMGFHSSNPGDVWWRRSTEGWHR